MADGIWNGRWPTDAVAVVTGAGSGIGQATAIALAAAGFCVHAVGRSAEKLDETVRRSVAGRVIAVPLDITDRSAVADWVANLGQSVAVLVNNAGLNIRRRSMADLDPADWDRLIATNLTGTYHLLHAVLPSMRIAKRGLVVNIGSVAGRRGNVVAGAAYAASKFGVAGLTATLAVEEAVHGIRVSAIHPGEVNTPILDERPEPVPAERRLAMLQPEDVAKAVLFLAELPGHAHVPEMILKPLGQAYV